MEEEVKVVEVDYHPEPVAGECENPSRRKCDFGCDSFDHASTSVVKAVGCPHEMSWRVKDDHRRRDSRPSSTRETRAKTDENGVFVWNRHTKKFT